MDQYKPEDFLALESMLQREARLGEKTVSTLPKRFLQDNHGKYLAIYYSGKVLAIADTLGELNDKLAEAKPRENYYLCRLGYPSLCRIE